MNARKTIVGALLVGAPLAHTACLAQEAPAMHPRGITAVEGLELGHHTLDGRPTGCTVVLARDGAVGAVDVRGSAPGTRGTDLLDPVKSPTTLVNAVVLSGGSAFGLAAADGVVRYLLENDIGYRVGNQIVPIVPGAIIYDLGLENGQRIRPGPDCGYAAAASASRDTPAEGSVGAGAGATVGKSGGAGTHPMKGGFGTASVTLSNGLTVAAAVVVNAVGDIVDPATGEIVAGALKQDGTFVDVRRLLREGQRPGGTSGSNTTIGVVATNATLTKAEATKVAEMAQDGLARTIYPAHTVRDGDTVFALATGIWEGTTDVTVVGALAADVMAEAILRAVRLAQGLPGIASVSDLRH
jgi:L-aminopeptidase/D-esterase-like protein